MSAKPTAARSDGLRALWELIAPGRGRLAATFLVAGLAALPALFTPLVIGYAVNSVNGNSDTTLNHWALVLVVLAGLTGVFWILRMFLVVRSSFGLEADIRREYFDHLLALNMSDVERGDVGQLVARGTADLRAVRTFLSSGIPAVAQLVTGFIFIIVAAGLEQPWLILVAVVPVVGILVSSALQVSRGTDLLHESRTRLGDATRDIDESLTGITPVRAFGQAAARVEQVTRSLDRSRQAMNAVFRRNARFGAIATSLPLVGVLGVIYIGGRLAILHHEMTLGNFVGLYLLLLMLAGPAASLGNVILMGQSAAGAAKRVAEVMNVPGADPKPSDAAGHSSSGVSIEADLAAASYISGGQPVLQGVSLAVPAGSHLAIAGRTGSGKSLLLRILHRLNHPYVGSLSVAGVSSLIREDDAIFSGTVRDTITYGRRDATDEQVRTAADLAEATEFIDALPHGFDSEIGGIHGVQLSGGQRQRLLLARGLLLEPDLMFLDQATASLDALTRQRVLTNLRRANPDRTLVAIGGPDGAHDGDGPVLTLDRGRIVSNEAEPVRPSGATAYLVVEPDQQPQVPAAVTTSSADPNAAHAASPPANPHDAPQTSPATSAKARARESRRQKRRARVHFTLELAAPDRKWYALLAVVVAIATATLLAPAFLAKLVVDNAMMTNNLQRLDDLGLFLAGTVVLVLLSSWAQGYLVPWVGQRLLIRLRLRSFQRLLSAPIAYFDRQDVGQLLSRLTNNIELLSGLIQNGIGVMISSAVLVLGTAIVFIVLDIKLALLAYLTVPVLIALAALLQVGRRWTGRHIVAGISAVTSFLRESLLGISTVHSFGQQQWHRDRFAELNHHERHALRQAAYLFGAFSIFTEVVIALDIALIVFVGGHEAVRGAIVMGTLVAFATYLRSGVTPIGTFATMEASYAQAGVAFDQLTQLLALPEDTGGTLEPPTDQGPLELRFDDVWFAYDKRGWVLRGLNLRVAPSETVLVVGASGAGKSTLTRLALRLYRPIRGRLCLGDDDLAEVSDHWLRQHAALVPQEPFVFSASVADNILFGRPELDRQAAEDVVARLGIADAFETLPDGLATPIGEGGYQLSAGQRQLVAIARAVAVDPQLLVLDEATSFLDPQTEATVTGALAEARRGRTTLVIAHHLHAARYADRIAVMAHGRIVEEGTHDELLAHRGHYADLWKRRSQHAGAHQ